MWLMRWTLGCGFFCFDFFRTLCSGWTSCWTSLRPCWQSWSQRSCPTGSSVRRSPASVARPTPAWTSCRTGEPPSPSHLFLFNRLFLHFLFCLAINLSVFFILPPIFNISLTFLIVIFPSVFFHQFILIKHLRGCEPVWEERLKGFNKMLK